MAEFNQIYTDSKLIFVQKAFGAICFNNGKVISKAKYALDNHTLTLLEDTDDNLSLYYNNGIANTYEFQTRLYKDDTILPSIDAFDKIVSDLNKDRMLVFLDGELEPVNNYEIINNGTKIKFLHKHTNDAGKIYKVFVYASDVNFVRKTYQKTSSDPIELPLDQYGDIVVPCDYNLNKTMIFVNGIKVPFNKIESRKNDSITEVVSNTSVTRITNTVKLNITEKLDEIISIDIINLNDKNDDTTALHFITRQGYLTYGPYDTYENKIPNKYDAIIEFSNQAKLVVDNLRPGFIIKEKEGTGQLIVVDENFETNKIKCLTIYPFVYTNYTSDQFYLEVPETTNIIKYLSEYDKKYTFLPELLSIFQRLLLDEIQDTIQRLRESRSISKVDSVSINKLISLLGFNLNIKTLTKKQRRELLEEINEFYRIAGTRNSYNLVNILQSNLKLIDIEQLFTIYNVSNPTEEKTIYSYKSNVISTGSGYDPNAIIYVKTKDNPSIHGVVKTTSQGTIPIGAFEATTTEGYDLINNRESELITELEGLIDIRSISDYYHYNHTISGTGFHNGDRLKTADDSFIIQVATTNGVDSQGRIINYTITPTDGSKNISLAAAQLYINNTTTNYIKIASNRNVSYIDTSDTYNFPYLAGYSTGGQSFSLTLDPGEYYVVMSGGGGAGAASDSGHGSTNDTYAEKGFAGQLTTTTFTLTSREVVTGIVGQGGGRAFARGSGPWNAETKGAGYDTGKMGSKLNGTIGIEKTGVTTSHHGTGISGWTSVSTYTYTKNYSYYSTGGQGGGSSALYTGSKVLALAAGGDGGRAYYNGNNTGCPGGLGGSGGTKNGTGAPGGERNLNDNTFWSHAGADGYIYIYKIREKYTPTTTGDTSGIGDGTVFTTVNSGTEFTLTFHRDTSNNLTVDINPTTGFRYVSGTFMLNPQNANNTGRLKITSTPTHWSYNGTLSGLNTDYVRTGQRFKNSDDSVGNQFTFTITSIENGKYTYTFTPTNGNSNINLSKSKAYHQTGSGAKIRTTSKQINTQKNTDRCYIDFYKKEELMDKEKGEGLYKEYRIDATDYGYVNEGTPNSPLWWEPGSPDIDYGSVEDDAITTPEDNYGEITGRIHGEWVEYWIWDRNPNYYPTNHVSLEMKMPVDVDFNEYLNIFVEQVYNLASTVVYIHSITESFYFGKDTTDSTNPKDNIGAPFGIATGAPVSYETITLSSNPLIQYQDHNTRSITVHPMTWVSETKTYQDGITYEYKKLVPIDATVTLVSTSGQTSGTGPQTIYAPLNSEVTWTISMSGHTTKTGKIIASKDREKYIEFN